MDRYKFWLNDKCFQEWCKKNDCFSQADIFSNWMSYEDSNVFNDLMLNEIFDLYVFINFELDVEFMSSVYELIEEEIYDDPTTPLSELETISKCLRFNKIMGKNIIDLSSYGG